MTEYVVKIGFWLRAYDSVTVEADADAEAIEKAKIAATTAMTSTAHPEHVDRSGSSNALYRRRTGPSMSGACTNAVMEKPPLRRGVVLARASSCPFIDRLSSPTAGCRALPPVIEGFRVRRRVSQSILVARYRRDRPC